MAEVLDDPTLAAKSRFDDESKWQIVRGRPVFTEHDEFEKDKESPTYGQLKQHFGEAELEEIAARCNARFEKTGDACPLVLGHTMPGKPEKEQPDICGYALNFRVGTFGPEQKLAILSDWYLFPELELHNGSGTGVLDQYPRCSVELYPNDKVFDPISLLRRTPELDMGLTVYSPQETAAIYQRLERGHRRRYIHKLFGPVIRYAMGAEMDQEPNQADLFARHFGCSDKVMQHFKAKYEAGDGEKMEAPTLADDLKEKFAKYGRYIAKHSKSYKKASKRYQDETGEQLDESDQYAAEDMTDEEKKEAAKFSKHFAKSKLMKYALEDEEDIPVEPAAPAPEVPPEVPPPPVEDDSIDYGADEHGDLPAVHATTADRYWKHMVRQGHVKKYLDQLVKKHYAAGFAGGSNTFTPPGPEGAGTPVPGGNKPEQFQKDKTMTTTVNDPAAIQYAKELQAVRKELAELKGENQKLKAESADRYQRERRATANVCVTQLEGEGYSFADRREGEQRRDQYVDRFAKADDPTRLQMMQEIRDNWRQEAAPVGGPQIHIAPDADPVAVQYARDTFGKQGGPVRFGREEKEKALQYMKDNNLPAEKWPEVMQKFERKIA